mmetsp:Transcript_23771/g.63673  ORF Transcript_23771/g.63673 Transcript_23771/m.63673 type:complete len:484 (-) Transcript_23771:95-1546(-)
MYGKVGTAGDVSEGSPAEREDLDERSRFQYLAVLQFLRAKDLLEAYSALESECGVQYVDGALPVASVLETSLDMFGDYRTSKVAAGGRFAEEAAAAAAAEEELLKLETGACCTGPLSETSASCPAQLPANVTAVRWASQHFDEFLALVASADKRLRLFGGTGDVLAEYSDFASPVLGLDFCGGDSGGGEVLATAMGGEVTIVRLVRMEADGRAWSLQLVQRFRDHSKHVTAGRFSPSSLAVQRDDEAQDADIELPSGSRGGDYFLTISRDHSARIYARSTGGSEPFTNIGVVRLPGEVTACCWLGSETFVLAARDDHNLLYWDVRGGADGGPKERLKTNLNALGDSVVSFAVLALAVSPNGKMIAACTDKSRVIVLQAFGNRQLRNLYGAVVEEYDTPSVCFSLDGTFIYTTSSLPVKGKEDDERMAAASPAMCGQISIFEVRTGEMVLQLPCHQRAVRCMDRHPQTEAIVTGSFDKTVKYWG